MLTLREHSAPKLKGKLTLRKVCALVMLTLRSLKLKASPPGDDYKELEIAVLSHNGKILVSSSIIGVEH